MTRFQRTTVSAADEPSLGWSNKTRARQPVPKRADAHGAEAHPLPATAGASPFTAIGSGTAFAGISSGPCLLGLSLSPAARSQYDYAR